jgi:hypothetical protein
VLPRTRPRGVQRGSAAQGFISRRVLRRLFADAGLTEPEIEEVPFAFPFTGEDDYWRFLSEVAGAIWMVLGRLDDEARAAVRANLATRLEPYEAQDGLELPAVSLVAAATRS